MANKIPKIDKDNNIVGETTIAEAKANKWPRRVVRVVIVDNDRQEILLQKRAKEVHSHPDMWETASSGHVDVGESELEAAERETKEEIGLEVDLRELASNIFSDSYGEILFNSIYVGFVDKSAQLSIDTHEVSEAKWFTITDLDELVNQRAEDCTPGLRIVWQTFRDRILE